MDKWTESELQPKRQKNDSEDNSDIIDNLETFFRSLTQGNFSLPITYWVFGVLGSVVWAVAIVSIIQFFELDADNNALLTRILYFGMIAYLCATYVGIWNSAGKYTGPAAWSIIAKFIVVVTAIPTLLSALKVLTT